MVPALVGLVALTLCQTAIAVNVDRQTKPGDVVRPEIVVPGEWMVDKNEHFLFLPLTVPADVPIEQCKVMSNGESLLVVVTERPQEEPQTKALKKYKLVMEAIKKEAIHDEALLKSKLQTWLDTEDDDEVQVHIKAALDSLTNVQQAKKTVAPKSISVPLGGVPKKAAAASSLLELDAAPIVVAPPVAAHALPALLRGATSQQFHHHHHATKVIKESFAVEVPYPVPMERIVLLRTNPTTLMVAMPLVKKSLEAKGISTGGKAFNRVPVFSNVGKWLAGPKAELSTLAAGLDLSMVVGQVGFEPLSDD